MQKKHGHTPRPTWDSITQSQPESEHLKEECCLLRPLCNSWQRKEVQFSLCLSTMPLRHIGRGGQAPIPQIGAWVDPRTCLNFVENRKILDWAWINQPIILLTDLPWLTIYNRYSVQDWSTVTEEVSSSGNASDFPLGSATFGQDTVYSDWGFVWFSSTSPRKC
jgi:hypothetical protein